MTNRFAETAGRLDRFIAEVKTRQYQATGAGPQPQVPARPLSGRHPDLDWQQTYAARTILPRGRGESAPSAPGFEVAPHAERPQSREPIAEMPGGPASAGGYIGAALGKPPKKRGVLARLFGGRDR
ncbi:hypothetical protein [Rhizomicrobium electricum]|uniref:Uncharacterized protein n=1 Tax=Rhizomicrobium electricum TaxID=480070 RepID=A0ABN1DYN6_9PROT|nr:hypothetical protein [Rhizomicrobium electricum]NIJ47220.1 hypothetical protein [Rhizomicrobium electricum]